MNVTIVVQLVDIDKTDICYTLRIVNHQIKGSPDRSPNWNFKFIIGGSRERGKEWASDRVGREIREYE